MHAADNADLRRRVEAAWADSATLSPNATGDLRDAVEAALAGLDAGTLRVAAPTDDGWAVHPWLKMAVLLAFRLNHNRAAPGIAGGASWDKFPLKTEGWDEDRFDAAGFRALPGALVRHSAFIGRGAVLMPSFINAGARVGEGTMIDTWSTVGSCAQIGRHCHISGGVGIGGVLEPLQASPVIIEDDCFIGARSEVAEGFVVGRGSVIAMGVFLGASTKVIDRATGTVHRGSVPPYSVVVPGALPGPALPDGSPGPSLACAVIVKRVDEGTRAKTSINDLLRD